ncbi:MAG: hypothetical protein RL021_515 [Bacteroidota bacterium]|jgi:hypothetical protein
MNLTLSRFILVFLLICRTASGQDLLSDLGSESKQEREFVQSTFKATRLINFHTLETVGPKTLDFRISHRFGTVNEGAYNAWGLDASASIRLGLEYSYDGRFMFGIGRSNVDKMVDGFLKYRLVRQGLEGGSPVAVTLLSAMYRNGVKSTGGVDRFAYPSDRFSYVHQVIIGRKFSPTFSIQAAPFFVHYNLVEKKADKNDMYGIAGATRIKFTKRSAITLEYGYRLVTDYATDQTFYNSFGIGYELETGGHVFQVHFTNSFGIADNEVFAHTRGNWNDGGFRLGFNISRVFSVPAAGQTKGASW